MKRFKARVPFTSWCCYIVIGNRSRVIIMGITYISNVIIQISWAMSLIYFIKYTKLPNTYNREFTKPQQRRRGQRRLKYQFLFDLRISRHSEVINVVSYCQNYGKLNPEHSDKFGIKIKKIAVVLHVLQTTQNLVNLRRRFEEDDKENKKQL